jgi:hypothetical protein
MDMFNIDLTFAHSYEVEELHELPGNGQLGSRVIYFPLPKTRPEHDGLWLKFQSASGPTWIGVFKFGYQSPPAISRVVSSSDPNRVCVVSKGAAYIVKVDNPEIWEEIPLMPVLDVQLVPGDNLLILSDFTRLAACGSSGLIWRSPRVCWDGLKILEVSRDTVEGIGYDPTNSITYESRFVVDLRTGRSLLPPPASNDGKPLW